MGKKSALILLMIPTIDKIDLSQTDSCATPGVKKQFLISCFYERARPEPIRSESACRARVM